MEIGQRVRIVGTQEELKQYSAERGYGHTGIILDIDDATTRVSFEGGIRWFRPEHLEAIPDDGKQPVAAPEVTPRPAPILRQKNSDGEVMSARNVLLKFPDLATHQPHLFLRGSYAWYSLDDLNTPPQNYIVLDAVHESGATCTLVTYRVFVIDEGE